MEVPILNAISPRREGINANIVDYFFLKDRTMIEHIIISICLCIIGVLAELTPTPFLVPQVPATLSADELPRHHNSFLRRVSRNQETFRIIGNRHSQNLQFQCK